MSYTVDHVQDCPQTWLLSVFMKSLISIKRKCLMENLPWHLQFRQQSLTGGFQTFNTTYLLNHVKLLQWAYTFRNGAACLRYFSRTYMILWNPSFAICIPCLEIDPKKALPSTAAIFDASRFDKRSDLPLIKAMGRILRVPSQFTNSHFILKRVSHPCSKHMCSLV